MVKKKQENKHDNVEKDTKTDDVSGPSIRVAIKDELRSEEAKTEVVESKVVEVNVDYKEKFVRAHADFENYKRRIDKERMVWMVVSQAETIKSVLPILDELDLAIQTGEKNIQDEHEKTWLSGFELIQKNAQKILSNLDVKEIDCRGEFNPNFHEALMQVDSDEHKTGEVVQVLSKGYMLKDEVVRHAKVSVAK